MNGVKLKTKKEYDAEVAAILPEDVFRMITNPLYFPTMKAQDQKAMLLEMAGNVTNEEVANINPKFQELISLISGRTLEQLAKEIASKKSAIKDELRVFLVELIRYVMQCLKVRTGRFWRRK